MMMIYIYIYNQIDTQIQIIIMRQTALFINFFLLLSF